MSHVIVYEDSEDVIEGFLGLGNIVGTLMSFARMVPQMLTLVVDMLSLLPQLLKMIPMIINLLVYIVSTVPTMIMGIIQNIKTFITKVEKVRYTTLLIFFAIYRLPDIIMDKIADAGGYLPIKVQLIYSITATILFIGQWFDHIYYIQESIIWFVSMILRLEFIQEIYDYPEANPTARQILYWFAGNQLPIFLTTCILLFTTKHFFLQLIKMY